MRESSTSDKIPYVLKSAYNWLQDNATMYKGDNASDCMVCAYIAGATQVIQGAEFDLIPACKEALEAVDGCLSSDGDRCAPNMGDFVAVANALCILAEFQQRFHHEGSDYEQLVNHHYKLQKPVFTEAKP